MMRDGHDFKFCWRALRKGATARGSTLKWWRPDAAGRWGWR